MKLSITKVLESTSTPCIEIDFSLTSNRIVWVFNHLINKRGKPKNIRMDNGPEFIAQITNDWSQMHEIDFKYIQSG